MLIKTPKDHEQRNHVSCDGNPLDRAVDSNFAHHLQLLNRFDINFYCAVKSSKQICFDLVQNPQAYFMSQPNKD